MAISIPTAMTDITPAWLTAALGPEIIGGAAVTDANITSLSEGVGFIGEVAKIELAYDSRPDDAPEAVIAKIPIGDPGGRMLGTMLRLYERESTFYDSMAADVEIRVPACYHNAADTEAGNYCLLLEDLGHLKTIDQRVGTDVATTNEILATIARFHARWEGERGARHDWLPGIDDAMLVGFIDQYPAAREALHANFSDYLDPKMEETAERLDRDRHKLLTNIAALPQAITHGDFRLDNMFFDDNGVVLFDWQVMSRATPLYDVIYFLGTNIAPEVLTEHHEALLSNYGDAYADAGGRTMSLDEMLSSAQTIWGAFTLLGPILLTQLDFSSEAGTELFDQIYARGMNAANVFDAHSYLP